MLLKYENLKLKDQLIFSIPVSIEICGRECKGCYALKPQKRFPKVLEARNRTYEITKGITFIEEMTHELDHWDRWLTKNRPNNQNRVVRIHEAGEFYSEEYIKKWGSIATLNPEWTFYTFTKRLNDFPEALKELKAISNIYITDSLFNGKINYGEEEDSKLIYTCPATVEAVKCSPSTCDWCYKDKGSCDYGVYFKQH